MQTTKLSKLAMVLSFAILPFPGLSTLLTTLAAWMLARKWTVPVFFLSLKWDLVRLPGYVVILVAYFKSQISIAVSHGIPVHTAIGGMAGAITTVDFLFLGGIYFALRFFEKAVTKRVRIH